MDEQQMINDILDSIYGYNILLKEGDKDTIALKKKEREEKHSEILTQINSICSSIEKELKNMLGTDEIGIKKYIRLNVLKSIKAEIENGNKVIDSNGKISVGKIADIVAQSKNEILEIKIDDEDIHSNKEDTIEPVKEENEKLKQEISDNLENFGIKLSEDGKKELEIAVQRVRAFLKVIKEKVDSGMDKDEAISWYFNQMSEEEKQQFMIYLNIAGRYEIANVIEQAKRQNPEKTETTTPQDESQLNGGETQNSKTTKGSDSTTFTEKRQKIPFDLDKEGLDTLFRATNFGHNIKIPVSGAQLEAMAHLEYHIGQEFPLVGNKNYTGLNIEDLVKSQQSRGDIPEMVERLAGNYRFTGDVVRNAPSLEQAKGVSRDAYTYSGEKLNPLSFSANVEEFTKTMLSAYEYCKSQLLGERSDFTGILGENTFTSGDIGDANEMFARMQHNEKTTYFTPLQKIPVRAEKEISVDASIDDYIRTNGVEMAVDQSALTQLDASTLTPATHEQIHSAMSLEEVAVDGAAVTQGESLEEAVTSRTLNGDILTAFVEGQGVVREIVEANGKVQDLTSPEKPLETPTEEKKDTQSAPVADNGDKGEDGPGEL